MGEIRADIESMATEASVREAVAATMGWVVLTTIVDLGAGLLLGSGLWWLGWRRAPIADFFIALAGLGGALLIAFSVTVTQVLPLILRIARRAMAPGLAPKGLGAMLGSSLGVALSAVVGLGACLAMVRDPPTRAHWIFMGLFGVSVVTAAALALAVGAGTMAYVVATYADR